MKTGGVKTPGDWTDDKLMKNKKTNDVELLSK